MPNTKLTAFRLTAEDLERVEQLRELFGTTNTDIIRRGIRALAREHGILAVEGVRKVRELIARYPDSEVALAVLPGSATVPVSIDGEPTNELVAACRPDPVIPDASLRPGLPDPVPVILWIPGSEPTIKFEVDPQRPGTVLRFAVADLWERWTGSAAEPGPETVRANRELRAAAGYASEEEDEED
jgi:hypothetical protein